MRLILARHGETAGNRDRLALGRLDIPLNETGHLQAEALARRLQDVRRWSLSMPALSAAPARPLRPSPRCITSRWK